MALCMHDVPAVRIGTTTDAAPVRFSIPTHRSTKPGGYSMWQSARTSHVARGSAALAAMFIAAAWMRRSLCNRRTLLSVAAMSCTMALVRSVLPPSRTSNSYCMPSDFGVTEAIASAIWRSSFSAGMTMLTNGVSFSTMMRFQGQVVRPNPSQSYPQRCALQFASPKVPRLRRFMLPPRAFAVLRGSCPSRTGRRAGFIQDRLFDIGRQIGVARCSGELLLGDI